VRVVEYDLTDWYVKSQFCCLVLDGTSPVLTNGRQDAHLMACAKQGVHEYLELFRIVT